MRSFFAFALKRLGLASQYESFVLFLNHMTRKYLPGADKRCQPKQLEKGGANKGPDRKNEGGGIFIPLCAAL